MAEPSAPQSAAVALRTTGARADGFWRRAAAHPGFVIGAVLVLAMLAAALVSLVWTPYPPLEIDVPQKLQGPSAAHWLGTDGLGRDIGTLLLVGAQNSLVAGVVAVGIGVLAGVALGALAAARGAGWTNA
ncbi:dipeptide transport system permease protein DppC [Caldimonas brevitalea]|uniref:Dipeptide transport system permease protein DppC n=1 Tax=Caldimonas brevitalea TaxID=413882 RepID=A0A0G3BRH6_9BURK|nr:dipeptide transport system permease protein DppC [Caldimonas brevitalea]